MRYRPIILTLALLASPLSAHAQNFQNWGPTTAYTTPTPLVGVPASLTADGSWTSACLPATFARAYVVFGALTKAGTLQTQRYADSACTQPIGAAIPSTALALTQGAGCALSSYCGSVAENDGQPFGYFQLTLTDTSDSTNAVVAVVAQQGAE